jgi:hypothetical protein
MPTSRLLPLVLGLLSALPLQADLSLLSGVSIPGGGEVVAHYDAPSGPDLILVTNSLPRTGATSHRVDIFALSSSGALTATTSVDLDGVFGAAATLSISSVAADPLGRGFGAATVIPTDNTRVLGKLVFFDLANGSILRVVDVGFHPDSVTFTPNGSRAIVANEGEFAASQPHAPGSVSIVNLSGNPTGTSLLVNPPLVTTIDFNTGLGAGVTLDALRINVAGAPAAERYLHVEPEYPTATNDKAYVTLQEANAIAVIDLTGANANRITAILPLGTISQRIDASDRDPTGGGVNAINIDDIVPGLPMPDTIATFVVGGRRFLATANEGDARTDDGDISRAGAANVVDTVSSDAADLRFAGSIDNSSGIGRLNISLVDGNLDADPLIEVPTMIGTRSFTLWDDAGNRVFDSGSMLEEFVRLNAPLTFNMNSGAVSNIDSRSDDKGPEPEALAYGEIDGRRYIFVGAERQNGVFQFDITDLNRVEIVGYYNVVDGVSVTTGTRYVSPETMVFVPAAKSPTGRPLLVVGYEGVEPTISGSVAVFDVVPTSGGLLNGSFRTTATAGQTLIMGFGIAGADNVLLRAVGPGLNAAFNIPGVLEDPRVDLYRGPALIASNDDWGGSGALVIAANAVGAFPLPPASRDAALLRALVGGHTLHLPARTSGAVLLETYGVGAGTRVGNLSARSRVGGTEGPLIGGFVVGGTGMKSILVRAVGPALGGFGVANVLTDPRIDLFRGSVRVASNDDWAAGATAADFASAGAFPLGSDAKSAALRVSLAPGAYTVHAIGTGSAGGEVLLEIYEIR